jgi:hypothetical protein
MGGKKRVMFFVSDHLDMPVTGHPVGYSHVWTLLCFSRCIAPVLKAKHQC